MSPCISRYGYYSVANVFAPAGKAHSLTWPIKAFWNKFMSLDTPQLFPLPAENKAVTDFLQTRRSNMSKAMMSPGPTGQLLQQLLEIAARVPDHRKLGPWRFVLFEGKAREDFGAGYIYMGSTQTASTERARPDVAARMSGGGFGRC